MDQKIATALLPLVAQTALDAALAIRDGRLDAVEAAIAALQGACYQTAANVARSLRPSLPTRTPWASAAFWPRGTLAWTGTTRTSWPSSAELSLANQPAVGHRRPQRRAGGAHHRRRHEPRQRPGVALADDLGPARGHHPELALPGAPERQPEERQLHAVAGLRRLHSGGGRRPAGAPGLGVLGTLGSYDTSAETAAAMAAAGVQAQGDLQVVATVSSGNVTAETVNLAPVGNARLRVACGSGEGLLTTTSAGGVELFAPNQAIFPRTSSAGQPNLIVESNTGGANDGEVIVNYGFQHLSNEELQQLFNAVAPKWYRRTEGSQKRTLGFIANEVRETGAAGQALCGKLVDEELGELVTLDSVLRAVAGLPGAPGARGGAGEEGKEARRLVIRKWTRRT